VSGFLHEPSGERLPGPLGLKLARGFLCCAQNDWAGSRLASSLLGFLEVALSAENQVGSQIKWDSFIVPSICSLALSSTSRAESSSGCTATGRNTVRTVNGVSYSQFDHSRTCRSGFRISLFGLGTYPSISVQSTSARVWLGCKPLRCAFFCLVFLWFSFSPSTSVPSSSTFSSGSSVLLRSLVSTGSVAPTLISVVLTRQRDTILFEFKAFAFVFLETAHVLTCAL